MAKYLFYITLAAFLSFSASSCITRPPHRHGVVVVEKPGHGRHHKKPKPPKKPKKPKKHKAPKHPAPPPAPPHHR